MHRKKRKAVILIAVMLLLLVAVFFGIFRVRKITVTGSGRYTSEQMEEKVLHGFLDYNTICLWMKTKLGVQESIPFVQKYDIKITGVSEIEIVVYEKSIVGYVYSMGACLYFDKDGIIVETTGEGQKEESVPLVSGLKYDYAVLHEKIPLENEETFSFLLNVTQLLSRHELSVKEIRLSEEMEVTLMIGNVRVELGKNEDMAEKINDLKSLEENLLQYSGVLDMKEYDRSGKIGYILRRDDYVKEEPESENQTEENASDE